MADKILLKELLFNKNKVQKIANEIHHAYPAFQKNAFIDDIVDKFPELELKARISWIAECLKTHLPTDYKKALKIILKSLPEKNNPDLSDDDFGDFIYAPYAEYVARNGCTQEFLDLSLQALYEITQRFSAEDAIRYFLNSFPEETLKTMLTWSKDSHYHVRRLCSEGTRPKLPWSQKIKISPTAPIPILDNLFCDSTRFVTRSVANHLNDISKTNPDLTLKTLAKWQKSRQQNPKEMEYIMRHALRTLTKQGHPEALAELGFSQTAEISISKLIVPKQIKMNTVLEFSFVISSEKNNDLLIDYIIYFQNKDGKIKNKKVFKLTKVKLIKNKPITISKRHPLREHMTTRTLYRGKHELEIQINGKRLIKNSFLII